MFKRSGKIRGISLLLMAPAVIWLSSAAQAATKITAGEIKRLIADHVEQYMPWPSGRVRINFPTIIADMTLAREYTLEVQNRPYEDFVGDTSFIVKVLSGGTVIREDAVRVRLEVLMDSVVSARPLAKDREISAGDVRVIKMWSTRVSPNGIAMPSEVIGKALTLNLRENSEITKNIIREHLLVKKGNIVRIVLDKGNLRISTFGISEEDGAAEKLIRVKNMTSNRIIYARVAGDSLVTVEY